jgi:hypothetical protein
MLEQTVMSPAVMRMRPCHRLACGSERGRTSPRRFPPLCALFSLLCNVCLDLLSVLIPASSPGIRVSLTCLECDLGDLSNINNIVSDDASIATAAAQMGQTASSGCTVASHTISFFFDPGSAIVFLACHHCSWSVKADELGKGDGDGSLKTRNKG